MTQRDQRSSAKKCLSVIPPRGEARRGEARRERERERERGTEGGRESETKRKRERERDSFADEGRPKKRDLSATRFLGQ